MDMQRLRYFLAVAQTEHVSAAAQRLHISQPALSKALALLEDEVGAALFRRSGRGIRLTAKGRSFLCYVEQALALVDNGLRYVRGTSEDEEVSITLQTNITGDAYLTFLVQSFRQKNPGTHFTIITTYSKSRFRIDCDCYINSDKVTLYNCTSVPLFREAIMLAVPAAHPLAKGDGVHLAEVVNEPFIGITETQSWSEEVGALCAASGFTPRYRYICDSGNTIVRLIAAGEGVGFLPEKSMGTYPPEITLLRITNVVAERQYNLSWRQDVALCERALAFITFTRRYFAAL